MSGRLTCTSTNGESQLHLYRTYQERLEYPDERASPRQNSLQEQQVVHLGALLGSGATHEVLQEGDTKSLHALREVEYEELEAVPVANERRKVGAWIHHDRLYLLLVLATYL